MKEIRKETRIQSYYIDENLIIDFKRTAMYKNDKLSDVVNDAIRNYIISNKAEVNELMLKHINE